jgi:iron complex outermembrane receptor protein
VAGSVIRAERLRAPGAKAAEVLRAEPGVAVNETGGAGALATASVRGATSAQTPVYLAGVRLNDDVAGTADLSLVPLWLVERVEIYRGNAPVEADQLGIGGAIFFEPRRPKRPEGAAGLEAGSFASRSLWAHASHGDERAAALVGVRVDAARNDYPYVDDRGTRFDPGDDVVRPRANADVATYDVWALGSSRAGRAGRVDVVANATRRDQGVPGLSLLPTRSARASLARSMFALTGRAECAAEGRCTLELSTAALVAHAGFDDPEREIALGATRVDVRGERVEQSALARVDVTDRVTITPAARAAVERLGIDPAGQAGMRATRMFSRGALGAEWRVARLVALRGLASGECHGTSRDDPRVCNLAEPAGRAGISIGDARLALHANLGRYARVPTLGELYGASAVVRGNESLVAEHGVTGDAGVRASSARSGSLDGAWLDAFAFVRSAGDLVAFRRSSLGYVRPYNVGSARLAGLELLAGAGFADFARLEVTATLLDARDTTEGRAAANDILPLRSRLVLVPRLELRTRALRGAGIDLVRLDTRYVHQASRYADEAGLVVIPAQGSLDVAMEVRLAREHVSVMARLADALDQARFDVIGYPLPGRAAFGAMELRWW